MLSWSTVRAPVRVHGAGSLVFMRRNQAHQIFSCLERFQSNLTENAHLFSDRELEAAVGTFAKRWCDVQSAWDAGLLRASPAERSRAWTVPLEQFQLDSSRATMLRAMLSAPRTASTDEEGTRRLEQSRDTAGAAALGLPSGKNHAARRAAQTAMHVYQARGAPAYEHAHPRLREVLLRRAGSGCAK